MNKHNCVKILVADDAAIVREGLVAILDTIPGIQSISQTGNVGETVAAIQRDKPDLMILDYCMPDGTALDVLKAVRKYRPTPTTIVFTGYDDAVIRARCIMAGAHFFFVKGGELSSLIDTLREIIRGLNDGMTLAGSALWTIHRGIVTNKLENP